MKQANGDFAAAASGPPGASGSQPPSLGKLFAAFLRIGLFTVGGGMAMVGVMRHELVDRRAWLAEPDFNDLLAFAASVPGALSVNLGFLIGQRFRGWRGAALCTLGVILPAFATILAIVALFESFLSHPIVLKFFTGAAGAVAAQIVFSTLRFGASSIRDFATIAVAAVALAVLLFVQVHPLIVVLGALLLRAVVPMQDPKSGDPPSPGKESADV